MCLSVQFVVCVLVLWLGLGTKTKCLGLRKKVLGSNICFCHHKHLFSHLKPILNSGLWLGNHLARLEHKQPSLLQLITCILADIKVNLHEM